MKNTPLLFMLLLNVHINRGAHDKPITIDQKTINSDLKEILDNAIIEIKKSIDNQTYTNLKGAERYFLETLAKTIPLICAIIIVWSNQPRDNLWRMSLTWNLGLIIKWNLGFIINWMNNNKWPSFSRRKV